MCGLCGFTDNRKDLNNSSDILVKMTRVLQHRGPDAEGFYHSDTMHFGHRRLRIIDLQTGDQPIFNEDKSLVLVFNGEIYNFKELKDELVKKGHVFHTHSDTEVIIHLYEEKGEDCVRVLNGMFAFAIWDSKSKELFLARDRFGQKPLFYTVCGNDIFFASELKSLIMHPIVRCEIDNLSLAQYLAYEYIPTPRTIYKDIFKLSAGHYLLYKNGSISIRQYWDYYDSQQEHCHLSQPKIMEKLVALLSKAVSRRLMSDVPLGIFLSGGIDSSAIAALAVRHSSQKIKTFSITFDNPSFDESKYARRVSSFLGTEHFEKKFSVNELFRTIEENLGTLDEPFADSSFLPTSLLSKLAREHVTVALGGDGADELFCGYPTFQAHKLAEIYKFVPHIVHKNCFIPIAKRLPVDLNNISIDYRVKQFLNGAKQRMEIRHQYWLGAFSPEEQVDLFTHALTGEISQQKLHEPNVRYWRQQRGADKMNALSYLYIKTYLQDDILTKVDRASMLHSLEVRSPFLDVEFAQFVSQLPGKFKIRGFTRKYILRKALHNILPKEIINRSKKGFGIPIAYWFRNELKGAIKDHSFSKNLESIGMRKDVVNTIVEQHLSGKKDNRKKLWALFVLDNWLKKHKVRIGK
ncbi:MAG: asparagine synthase (glutamine-hydrolyzing), partial [Candidatus Omnitrophica bacterium]|nr:asparagine synthase (glutamine-hydrolyzing) [Candidatus Omnitrophota bacterium]